MNNWRYSERGRRERRRKKKRTCPHAPDHNHGWQSPVYAVCCTKRYEYYCTVLINQVSGYLSHGPLRPSRRSMHVCHLAKIPWYSTVFLGDFEKALEAICFRGNQRPGICILEGHGWSDGDIETGHPNRYTVLGVRFPFSSVRTICNIRSKMEYTASTILSGHVF